MCDEATKREKSPIKGSTNRSAVEQGTRDYPTLCCLRTADAFAVVASLPPESRRERSDDRKCVCFSQAKT